MTHNRRSRGDRPPATIASYSTTRTLNRRHTDLQSVAQNSQVRDSSEFREDAEAGGARGGARHVRNQPCGRDTQDPDLALLMERWADLPEHIKAAVLSLVTISAPRDDE